jgi:hypothetical protein
MKKPVALPVALLPIQTGSDGPVVLPTGDWDTGSPRPTPVPAPMRDPFGLD